MTIEQQIDAAVDKIQVYMMTLADGYLQELSYGGKPCGDMKLFMLGQWYFILKDYKIYNFGDNGAITPDYTCVTLAQINDLIAKVNALNCL